MAVELPNNLPVWNEGMPTIRPPYIAQAGFIGEMSIVQTLDSEKTTGMFQPMNDEYDQTVFNIMYWQKEEDVRSEDYGQLVMTALDVEPSTQLVVLAHPQDFMMNILYRYGHESGLGMEGKFVEVKL